MGYAGQPMKVVQANRALLSKRNTFKKVKEMFLDSAECTQLEFKEVSENRLKQIKAEIRRNAKADTKRETFIYIVCTIVVVGFFYWLLYI